MATARWSTGWLEKGLRILEERPDVALVSGRRRERFREQSIYNRLADLEWDMPVGEIKGSHGDIMVRAEAFRQVGGFDAEVLVSEDYELCVRLQKRGWILLRIDAEMTLHDMAMTRFGQWWWRSVRTGYGYADGVMLHGGPPERHFVRDVRSMLFWGVAVPLAILILAWPTRGASLCSLGWLSSLVLADSTLRGLPRMVGARMRGFMPSGVFWPSFPCSSAWSFTGSAGSPAVPSESSNTKGLRKPTWSASHASSISRERLNGNS